MTQNNLLDELTWRGLIHQCTDLDGLAGLLNSGRQTVYIGFDPTASSLHVGSMMQLMMLRRFQRAGHRPIALVGGATGMIGDPSGKSEERNLLSTEQLRANVEGVAQQMRRFLDFEGDNGAILLNNFEWMRDYSYLEFLRDVGKSFPIGPPAGEPRHGPRPIGSNCLIPQTAQPPERYRCVRHRLRPVPHRSGR